MVFKVSNNCILKHTTVNVLLFVLYTIFRSKLTSDWISGQQCQATTEGAYDGPTHLVTYLLISFIRFDSFSTQPTIMPIQFVYVHCIRQMAYWT